MKIDIPLNKVVTDLKKELTVINKKGLALDIDETLSWTIGYWVEQLQKHFGNPERLTVHEVIAKYRYSQNVPYWQTKEAMAWMDENRNSNEIQEMLPLIENSNTIIQKINEIIPITLYLTTRPDGVIEGTRKWLLKHKFPDVPIITRPSYVHFDDGNKYKAEVLEYLYPEITGIIDDNPSVVNHLSENYKGIVFLYDNVDHPRKDINVIPCKTWSDVFKQVKSFIH